MKVMMMRKTIAAGIALAICAGAANAAVVFTDNFESPDITVAQATAKNTNGNPYSGILPDNGAWEKASVGFGSGASGIDDEGTGYFTDLTDPDDAQAYAFRYTNSGITTKESVIGAASVGQVITVSFDVVMDGYNNGLAFKAYLVTFNGGTRTDMDGGGPGQGTTKILASKEGNASNDGLYTNVQFAYTIDATDDAAVLGHDLALRFQGATQTATIDNVVVDIETTSIPVPAPAAMGLVGLGLIAGRKTLKRRTNLFR